MAAAVWVRVSLTAAFDSDEYSRSLFDRARAKIKGRVW
mgnify:CR=1 FL=1